MLVLILNEELTDDQLKELTKLLKDYNYEINTEPLKIIRDKNMAEDIVQESFFKIVNNLDKILSQERDRKKAYVLRIVKSTTLDFMRKEKHWRKGAISLEDLSVELSSKGLSVEEIIILNEKSLEVEECLHMLSEKDEQIIIAKYYQGYSAQEICKLIGVESESTVRSMIYRAKNRLLAIMKKEMK